MLIPAESESETQIMGLNQPTIHDLLAEKCGDFSYN